MPHKAFLHKKSLLDQFKDDHKHTGIIQSMRAEHTWNNPLTRRKRTKELNGWIKSFAGKRHVHKLARFNAQQAGKDESYEDVKLDCLRYADILELPNGVCVKVNATIRCPRRAAFVFRITGIYNADSKNPSKYVIRGFYPVYGLERKPSEEFDIPCNNVSDIEQWVKSNEKGNLMQNEEMSLKGFIENLSDKLVNKYGLEKDVVKNYLDLHTEEMQELLNDTELSLKEKVLFVRSEITGEKDEKKSESISVQSLIIPTNDDTWADVPDDYYPEQVTCDICDGKYDDVVMHVVNSNILHKSFVVCDDCVSVAKEILEKEEHKLNKGRGYESKKSESKQNESLVLPNPTIIYRGTSEDAKKASHYISNILADKGLGWGRVSWQAPKEGEYHYGHPEKDVYTVTLRGSNDIIKDSFAVYKDVFGNDFWNNCNASPDGWVDPLTIARYDVATPRHESKKHEGFNTTRDLDNFALHILNYIKDKTHYPGYVRFVKLNDDEEDFYGKYVLSVNGKNYYLYVGDTDYSITDNNDENTLVEGSTDLSGAMNKDLDDFCERIQQPFYTESKKPTDEKLGYEKGHTNSKGEDAPWVIRSHEDNRVLASFATEEEAKEHLKRMKQYSNGESKQNEGLSNEQIKDAVKFAATEAGLEDYLKVDSDGAMSVTVSLPINSDDLKTVRWVIDSNGGTITEYLDTEKNLIRDFTDDESLVSMLTILFQTSRMELRDWFPKKSESLFNKQELEAPVKSYISNVLSDLVVSFHWGEDGAERLVDKYNDVIMTNYMDGDLSAYETAKYINGKENNNPVESKKKQESKKNEGHLELVDTIVVPKWLWDAFYFADEYGETLNEEEEEILADFKAKYADAKYHLETPEEEADFRSRNDFDEYGGPCYEIRVFKEK